jgi:hypothetical protein
LKDGSEFAIRGEQQAKRAWDALARARSDAKLNFESTVNKRA